MSDSSTPALLEDDPRSKTRLRVLRAAEEIFGRRGFHDASIAEITRLAGIAQGSFYLHFASKQAIFDELIRTRGAELRAALAGASRLGATRRDRERSAFEAFFRWTAEHPWLYRVARQAEFVNPTLREEWYRSFADVYARSLREAMDAGEIADADEHMLAWAIMGMADFTAMRYVVWEGGPPLTPEALESFYAVAERAVGFVG